MRTSYGLDGHERYTGSFFDDWRGNDENLFTSDDIVAASFLSVFVPPLAARQLLDAQADRFAQLLLLIGPDHDLADVPTPVDET